VPRPHDELCSEVHQTVRPAQGCGHDLELRAETRIVRVQVVYFLGKLHVQLEDLAVCQFK
jgi:hypothetical protein